MEERLIYRVIFTDQYQCEKPETNWHTSKAYCENYIDKSPYKHNLSLEKSVIVIDN